MGTQVPTAHPCTRRDLRGSSAALRQALGNSNRTAIPAQHYTSSNEPLLVGHTQDSSTTAETARRNVPSTRTRLPTRAGWTGPSQLNSTPAPPPPIATEPRGSAPLAVTHRQHNSRRRAAPHLTAGAQQPRPPSPHGRRSPPAPVIKQATHCAPARRRHPIPAARKAAAPRSPVPAAVGLPAARSPLRPADA